MPTTGRPRFCLVTAALVIMSAADVGAQDVHVMSSGGLAAAYLQLIEPFERTTSHKLITAATSSGVREGSIANRLRRREPADVVLLPDAALRELIDEGLISADSRVELARSGIGMAVRAGTPKPDIRTADALRTALLQAKSIAVSAQVSGLYMTTELFPRLGIAAQMKPKTRIVEVERVGAVVGRGEAEIGFQRLASCCQSKGLNTSVRCLPRCSASPCSQPESPPARAMQRVLGH